MNIDSSSLSLTWISRDSPFTLKDLHFFDTSGGEIGDGVGAPAMEKLEPVGL